jgi:hypothetical protein
MLRVGDVQFAWPSRHQVADIMQGAHEHPVAGCGFLTVRTGALGRIARFFDDLGLGQVLNPRDNGIGFILAGAQFR